MGGIGFIEFVEFIELKEKGLVDGSIPTAMNNSINTTNPMNTINKYAGLEGSR